MGAIIIFYQDKAGSDECVTRPWEQRFFLRNILENYNYSLNECEF